jgi:D-inositol-3-phosphate glycosyltransferase
MSKVVTIPPGVDLSLFRPMDKTTAKEQVGVAATDRNILFAGRIEPLKGVDTLLCAIALIHEQAPELVKNVCVTIIGGDPWNDDPDEEMARLHQLRNELGVSEVVTFVGAKDQEVLPNYYAAAEMVVMPSHYESFGMVALEAMAMRKPVIASEVGGLAFLVQDGINGFHVPSRDPESLAERIYTLLSDEACRQRLAWQACEYSQGFAWPNIVDQMIEVYADVRSTSTS